VGRVGGGYGERARGKGGYREGGTKGKGREWRVGSHLKQQDSFKNAVGEVANWLWKSYRGVLKGKFSASRIRMTFVEWGKVYTEGFGRRGGVQDT